MRVSLSGVKPARPALMPWVALLGMDGSGKTSVLRALQKEFAPPVTAGVKVKHRRPDIIAPHQQTGNRDPYARPMHNRLLSTLKLAAVALDWILGYWGTVAPQRRRGGLVVYDRYYLIDILVDPRRYRYGGPLWLAKWLGQVLPHPTVVILLDAPAEIVQARKREISLEECVRLRKTYLHIIGEQSNGYVVDCAQSLDQVISQTRQIILTHLPGA